ncbi:MAG: glycoside hydrolase family protein [Woeseiaceae bacterium]
MRFLACLLVVLVLANTAGADTDDLDFAALLQGVDESNKLYDTENWYNWGSSIVKGEDEKYHLFYAQMSRELGHDTWLTDGVISHAVSDSPAGPYTHRQIVLGGRGQGFWDERTAHNPWIQKYNGKYYLYYISTNFGGRSLDEEQLSQARTQWIDNEYRAMIRESQRIGVAVADSVYGPWMRLDEPIVEPGGPIETITCNPAVSQRPDGGYIMLVRGDMPGVDELVRHQAVALARTPTGPWTIQEKAAVDELNAEDPALWWDEKRQRYYGIYHAFGYMGLITSEDGLNWRRAKNYKIMDLAYRLKTGEYVKVTRMERPFVYLEDGTPKVLTVSIMQDDGESYSLFIPLAENNQLSPRQTGRRN